MRAAGFHGKVPAAGERGVAELAFISSPSILTMTLFSPSPIFFVEEEKEEEEVEDEGEHEEGEGKKVEERAED